MTRNRIEYSGHDSTEDGELDITHVRLGTEDGTITIDNVPVSMVDEHMLKYAAQGISLILRETPQEKEWGDMEQPSD